MTKAMTRAARRGVFLVFAGAASAFAQSAIAHNPVATNSPNSNAVPVFRQALESVLSQSQTIEIQRSRVRSADIEVTGRRFGFLPSLDLNATQTRAGDPQIEQRQIGATAQLNLFHFGAQTAQLKSARATYEAEEESLKATQLDTEKTGAESLISVIAQSLRYRALKENLAIIDKSLTIGRERYRKGFLPLQEVDKIAIDVSNAEAQLKDAEFQLNRARLRLKQLTPSDVRVEWPWRTQALAPSLQKLIDLEVDLRARPDYRSLIKGREAADYARTSLFRSLLPTLDLTYSQLHTELGGQWNPGWSVGLALSIPLFHGLKDYTEYRVQAERALTSELRVRELEKDVASTQKISQDNFRLAISTAESRERNLQVAQRLLNSSLARFREGRLSVNELALDQNRVVNSELSAIEGWSQFHLAVVGLCHAYGQSVLTILP